jgi:hypothetical protein
MKRRKARLTEHAVSSVVAGCRKYGITLRQGLNPVRADGNVRQQFDRFCSAMQQEAWVLDHVRPILCSSGVPPFRFVTYFNFARRLDRLIRTGLGEAVPMELHRWAATGLDRAVLSRICTDVFNITSGTNPIDGCDKGGVESNGAGTGNEPANRT